MLENKSRFSKWQEGIIISAVVLGFFISLIIAWVYTTQKSDNKPSFNYSVLQDRSSFSTFLKNFFPLFLNFLSAIPINFVLISRLSLHIYSRFIEWDVHTYTLKDVPTYVNDPKKLENLAYVEHIFTSKNGIMTDNNLIFKMCSIGEMIYGTEDSGDKKCVFERVEGFSFKDHRLHDDIIENTLNGVKCRELLKALAFCHSCKTRKNPVRHRARIFKYMNSEEEALLKAAHAFGFRFEARDKKRRNIRVKDLVNNEFMDYHIIGFHRQEINERLGVVLQRVGTNDTPSFYVKGPLNTMLDLLRESEFEDGNLEKHIHFFSQRNLKIILVAKKDFEDDEYADYDARKKELLSLGSDHKEKEQGLWTDLFTDLTLVGLIALDDFIDLRVSITIDEIKKNGIKFWMLTGDNQDSALSNAFKQGLITHNSHPMVVSGSTDQEIQNSLKYYIKSLSQSKKNEVNLALEKGVARMIANNLNINPQKKAKRNNILVMDSSNFQFISGNYENLLYFQMLILLCDAFIISNLTPNQKAEIVRIVKGFPESPTTLAVGSGIIDIMMMNEAHLSVAVESKLKCSDIQAVCDIKASDLSSLIYLLFRHGIAISKKSSMMIYFSIYKTMLLFGLIVFSSVISSGSSTMMIGQVQYLIYTVIFCFFLQILFTIFYKDIPHHFTHRLSCEYKENISGSIISKKQLVVFFIMGLLEAGCIWLFTVDMNILIQIDGMTVEIETLQSYCFYFLLFSYCFKVLSRFMHLSIISFLVILPFFVIMIPSSYFVNPFQQIDRFVNFPHIFSDFLLICMVSALIEYIFGRVYLLFIKSVNVRLNYYLEVEERIMYEYLEDSDNDSDKEVKIEQNIPFYKEVAVELKEKNLRMLSKTVTASIERSDSMESVLEEIANSNNKNATNNILGLNEKSLDFYDRNKNIEFKNATLVPYMVMIRVILGFFGVTMIALAIFYLISNPIEFIIISFSALFLCIITFLLSYLLAFRKRIQIMIIIDFAVLIILSGFVGYLYNDSTELFVALFMVICFQCNRYKVLFSGIVCFIFPMIIAIIDGIKKNISLLQHFEIIGKWLCFIIFFFFSAFIEEKYAKRQFLKQTKLKKEFKKSKNILNILLPNFVRERVRTGQRFIAEDQGVVTIIFIDFVDFDNIVQMHSPGELIEFLDKIYNAFDQMCNLHSLQKIETVGKSYMACGGLKAIEKNYKKNRAIKHHTIRILNFAFESVEYIKKRTLKNGQPLAVKVGIHTGKVISGVVGQHKPQFSLVGDTVNRTSRMCSKCESNRIHMTEDTQKYLKHLPDLKFESRQTEAKGLGVITTYFVSKKRTVNRVKNENMQSVEDLENEEEKASHESELFADSEDSRMKKIVNEDNEARNNDPQAQNPGKGPNDNFEQSMIIEREGSENGQNNDGEKSNNIVFEIPRYLICTKKKNRKYESYIFKKNVENYRIFFNISCVLVSIALAITEVSVFSGNKGGLVKEQVTFLICNGIMIFMSLILLYLSTQLTRKSPAPIIFAIYCYYIVAFIYSVFVEIDHRENRYDGINYFFIVIFICAYTSHLRVLMFKHMIIFYITAAIGWVIIKIVYPSNSIEQSLFLIYIIYSTMVNHYSAEKSFRISFNYERSLNHEIKRTQALLRNLVPPNVFRGLLKGKRIADYIQNVTLLYTDMCGFTAFSKTREPKEVVELLSKLFQKMDNLCIKNNVYKVHTIGDCYVVSGYTGKVSNEKRDIYQEAANVIETGFDMLDIIRDVREELAIQELDMRIGIHTGMMTAGIIGSNIVRYDIFGSDVLIANKMESSGLNGHVCCSEDTRKILIENFPDKYKFAKHVTVPVENLNKKVKEYIVNRNENQEGAAGSRFMSSESSSDDENEASAH